MDTTDEYLMSKKERRAAGKEAQRQEARAHRRGAVARRWLLWGGVAVVLAAIVVGVSWAAKRGSGDDLNSGANLNVDGPATGEWTRGAQDASVVLIEYSDFQCPACRLYQPIVEQLAATYPEDALIVYRHYPLRQIHAHAQLAGQAAEAAGVQGKFWEMHDVLFERQSEWSSGYGQSKTFAGYAEELGLDIEQFKADLDSDDARDRVNAGFNSGIRAGVQGTPTFFLNGEKIQNPAGYDAFAALIEAHIVKTDAAETSEAP